MLTAIVDIDGTLTNASHRQHLVQGSNKNWMKFYEGMVADTPHEDIIQIVNNWYFNGATILLCSGRPSEYRLLTKMWLENHLVNYHELYMRKTKDYRSDDIIKLELLDQMKIDGYNPTIALDDRDRVVKAWRSVGIRCLQVAEGNF